MTIEKWRDDVYCPQCETQRYMKISMDSKTGIQHAECDCGTKLVNHGWRPDVPGNAKQQAQTDSAETHNLT